jgi:site-specific recombinase XerD
MAGSVDLGCAVRLSAIGVRRFPCRGTVGDLRIEVPRDRCGRRRSPATFSSFRKGKSPANAGQTYPAQPLTEDEVLALLAACPVQHRVGRRDRALIVFLWRSGVRISEALAVTAGDLYPDRGVVNIQRGKGSKQRFVAMDPWAWEQVGPWVQERRELPPGPVFCVVRKPTAGGRLGRPYVRKMLKQLALDVGIDKRVHPHGFRHSLACDLAGEMPLHLVQRQLGHSNLGTTATYLAGIAPVETWRAIAARSAPGAHDLEPKDRPEEGTT